MRVRPFAAFVLIAALACGAVAGDDKKPDQAGPRPGKLPEALFVEATERETFEFVPTTGKVEAVERVEVIQWNRSDGVRRPIGPPAGPPLATCCRASR